MSEPRDVKDILKWCVRATIDDLELLAILANALVREVKGHPLTDKHEEMKSVNIGHMAINKMATINEVQAKRYGPQFQAMKVGGKSMADPRLKAETPQERKNRHNRESRARVKARRAKAKTPPDVVLANKRGPTTKPRDGHHNTATRGLWGDKILPALKQTTGKVTTTDLASILEEPLQNISASLSAKIAEKFPGLNREPHRSDETGRAQYLYWLTQQETK